MYWFLLGLISSLIMGKLFIGFLKKKKIIQPILEDAPTIHQLKAGTPTMGGIIFLIPLIVFTAWLIIGASGYDVYIALGLFIIMLGYGYIGFTDDFQKVLHKKNEKGLSAKAKLILQFLISALVIVVLVLFDVSTAVKIGNYSIDFGVFYYLIVPVCIVGFSNASNFTDGLDGLLGSLSVVIFTTLLYFSNFMNNEIISMFCCFFIGTLIAFLYFNKFPAKLFMGDTGSLVIGSLFSFIIIILKIEVLGLFIGLIFILEVLSVVIQVTYFKKTKQKYGEGRRIFKMAPIHHHFEQGGMSENKVVMMFTFVQIIICITAVAIF